MNDDIDDLNDSWRQRVTHSELVDPEQLLANPYNFRIHSMQQQRAMEGVLGKLGWLGRGCLVNSVTGRVIDGHMRVSLAMSNRQPVPVDYVELTEDEERLAIATYDPIGGMAVIDSDAYVSLAGEIDFDEIGKEIARVIQATAAPLHGEEEGNVTPDGLGDGERDLPANDPDQFVFGYVRWVATRIDATGEEIETLTRLYNSYIAERDGLDAGFVAWLTEPHA